MISPFLARMSGRLPTSVLPKGEVVVAATQIPSFATKIEMAKQGKTSDIAYAEVTRVCKLPIKVPLNEDELEAFSRKHLLVGAYMNGTRLFPAQAEALRAFQLTGGGVHPIGVGFGKTLASLLIASDATTRLMHRKIVYFCPSHLVTQFVDTDIPWARQRIPLPFSIHVLGGRDKASRLAIARSDKRGLYVFPYSLLSLQDARDLLMAIQPDLIIADEAHRLANPGAARTKRVRDLWNNSKCLLVALSGTITRKKVTDYHHLAHRALGEGNFLPNSTSLAHEWGSVLDADGGNLSASAPLLPLLNWARANFPDKAKDFTDDQHGFRHAFQRRLCTTPGVYSTGDASIGTSLTICTRPVEQYEKHQNWPALKELIDKVEGAWLTPNNDPIEHAIHTHKWMMELTAGFYNMLKWPSRETLATRKKISQDQADEVLGKSENYHLHRRLFSSELRLWLEANAADKIDTPFLVEGNMYRHGDRDVGDKLYSVWRDMKDLDFETRIERDSSAVRVCDYKILEAAKWACLRRGEGGIIWYYHNEVGEWIREMLEGYGVDCLHCPAGSKANSQIINHDNKKKIIIASQKAHGEGKNLQHFEHQFFTQWPRPAADAEQTLGRLHRSGQKADELQVFVPTTTLFDQMNFAACLNDALYIHTTTDTRQKLIYCNYDPLPKIFPASVLRERGFSPDKLDKEAEAVKRAKFGSE